MKTLLRTFLLLSLFGFWAMGALGQTVVIAPTNGTWPIKPDAPFTESSARTIFGGARTLTRVNSSAYEASHILKTSAGNLVTLVGYNSGDAGFVQVFDSATLPAEGTAPAVTFAVPATANFSLDVAIAGIPFANGITVCISSTANTKTIASATLYLTAVVK